MSAPPRQPRLLLVDDDEDLRYLVAELLVNRGYEVLTAANGQEAVDLIAHEDVDAAMVDLVLGDSDGIEILERIKQVNPWTEVLIATGNASVDTAVRAMRRGAFTYISKPLNLPELQLLLERAVNSARAAYERYILQDRVRRSEARDHGDMVAASSSMREVCDEAAEVALIEKPIFIHGETGTGKDLLATFCHRNSPRRTQAFNVLNCGTLTEQMVDAELFGHEKGAFTGADEARPGIIAASDGGTLFLDEIGDIPAAAQVRLLRFLENGVVRAVGSTRERRCDVRIIAASHRDLAAEVSAGRFREDLFHRLVVFQIDLPPLRDRPDDIRPLVERFLANMPLPDGPASLDDETERLLRGQPWDGNIRELRNEVERAWLRARRRGSAVLEPEDFRLRADAPSRPTDFGGYGLLSLDDAQRLHVRQVLDLCEGSRQRSAEILGVSERHLYRLLKQERDHDDQPVH